MSKIFYLDPEILENLKMVSQRETDGAITDVVDTAVRCLPDDLQEVVRARHFEGLSMSAIAKRMEKSQSEISGMLYEAIRLLKIGLADFVKNRWGIKVDGICRVCSHPDRVKIERILIKVDNSMSWSRIARKIESATGERFHPPQILRAHLKHMQTYREKT